MLYRRRNGPKNRFCGAFCRKGAQGFTHLQTIIAKLSHFKSIIEATNVKGSVRTLIEVEHLTKRYGGHTAVDDISFTVEDGCIYGLLGPNGAGKSNTCLLYTSRCV